MASIYPRKGSRFYWIKFRDASGKIKAVSSKIDVDWPNARNRAKEEAAHYTLNESLDPRSRETEKWEAWAAVYMEERYRGTGSHKNVMVAMKDFLVFFQEKGIRTPRMLDYATAADFVPWRMRKHKVLKPVQRNTARLRFVYLRILMAEAVRRGYARFNPCRDVKVKGAPPKQKQEITEGDEKKIEKELKSAPQWMQDQWIVMMRQGCRVAESRCPLSSIDTKRMTITFRIKGGRTHTAGLHSHLLPIIERAKTAGQERLIEGSPNDAARWCDFFKDLKKRKILKTVYSSHCCRVTVITRLLRAGHTSALVASFIGHTEEINRIYRRLKPQDSSALLVTLGDTSNPSSRSDRPETQEHAGEQPGHAQE